MELSNDVNKQDDLKFNYFRKHVLLMAYNLLNTGGKYQENNKDFIFDT